MTAVEFLLKWINDNLSESLIPIHVKEQAKEMEKQQMCQFAFDYQDEFFNNGKVPPIEQYYNETYGSKGSDDHIVDTNEMISSQTENKGLDWLVNRWKKLQAKGDKMSWNQIIQITELAKELPSSQTEISDEEIEKGAENYGWRIKTNTFSDLVKVNELAESAKQDFIAAIKWYREQLKQRQ